MIAIVKSVDVFHNEYKNNNYINIILSSSIWTEQLSHQKDIILINTKYQTVNK